MAPNNEIGEDLMDRRAARLNIEHYRNALADESNEKSRQTVLRLLAAEETNLTVFEHSAKRQKSHDETEEIAGDSGLSVVDTRTLAMLGIHGANFLRCRMLILRIDPDRFAHAEPAGVRELQKSCSRCESRETCVRDLMLDNDDPTRVEWREYCPNATALTVISALDSYY